MGNICSRCNGEGKYLGNGMILIECNLCNNFNDEKNINDRMINKSSVKIDKRSKHYKEAINDIMKSNGSLSRKEAEDIFIKIYEE